MARKMIFFVYYEIRGENNILSLLLHRAKIFLYCAFFSPILIKATSKTYLRDNNHVQCEKRA